MTARSLRVVVAAAMWLAPVLLFAQGTDSPAPPDDPSSAMPTLEDLYDRLATGADHELRTTFVEPAAGPGATGHTLQQVMDQAPAADDLAGAVPADVLSGATFWGLRTDGGGWGLQTGVRAPAPVGRTGQTTCYAGNGSAIPCAGTGQDGDLQPGVPWATPRFTANVDLNGDGDCSDDGEACDGTVTDQLTGLIWLRDAKCNGSMAWAVAMAWAEGLYDGCASCGGTNNDCGLSDGSVAGDWRLPSISELQSLIDWEHYSPSLSNTAGTGQWAEGDAFSGGPSGYYWSLTSNVSSPLGAWGLDLGYGAVNARSKGDGLFVWPVHDPQ